MAGKSMAIDLKPRGIAVALLHPGLVSTRMTGFSEQGITAEQAVTGLLAASTRSAWRPPVASGMPMASSCPGEGWGCS